MLSPLLFAGLALTQLQPADPVVEARIADVDGDGHEDVVAVTAKQLLVYRGGEAGVAAKPSLILPVRPLTVVGNGFLGTVDAKGRLLAYPSLSGGTKPVETGLATMAGTIGVGDPAILDAPGDVDGDGRDDPVLPRENQLVLSGNRSIPLPLRSHLGIGRSEYFAVEYEVPVPVVGGWEGRPRSLVLLQANVLHAWSWSAERKRFEPGPRIPLPAQKQSENAIRRRQVAVADVDGDGNLDVVVARTHGSAGLFSSFSADAMLFLGGRIYNQEKRGFFAPAARIKVPGAALVPDLVDVNGDGALDLVLSTVNSRLLDLMGGTLPGTHYLFLWERGRRSFTKRPVLTYEEDLPTKLLWYEPRPPSFFLPGLRRQPPALVTIAGNRVELRQAGRDRKMKVTRTIAFEAPKRLVRGRTRSVVYGKGGLVVWERKP